MSKAAIAMRPSGREQCRRPSTSARTKGVKFCKAKTYSRVAQSFACMPLCNTSLIRHFAMLIRGHANGRACEMVLSWSSPSTHIIAGISFAVEAWR